MIRFGVGVEEITAPDHVEHTRRIPIEPAAGPVQLHDRAERRDAAVHAVEVHGIDEIGPLERMGAPSWTARAAWAVA